MKKILALFALMAMIGTVNAGYYTVEQGGTTTIVTPVANAETASSYYDYYSVSSHTGNEEAYVSKIYLYEDSNTGVISFIMHHNIDAGGCSDAKVDFDFTGVPAGVTTILSDDVGELRLTQNPEGKWHFWNNTDGGVLGTFSTASEWNFTIDPSFYGVDPITKFVYLDGDGAETEIELCMQRTVTISHKMQTAPEFSSLAIALAALLTTPAFAYLLVKKRKG